MNTVNASKSWISVGLLAFSAAWALPALADAPPTHTTYDATADYSTTTNGGTNVWSYGYSVLEGAGYSMVSFDTVVGDAWLKSGYGTLGTPSIFKNNTSSTINGVAPGQLSLNPGTTPNGDFAILRFTAPSTHTYTISGQFFAGDIGTMRASVLFNAGAVGAINVLQFFPSTDSSPVIDPFTVTLHQGETLDFVVGNKGPYEFGSTPLSVQITAVPEPETFAMLLAGLGLMGFTARRKLGGRGIA